jgi:putative ABC transport system permease protein
VKALHTKLLRDLARTWAQALTIGLVLACGVASYVAMRGAYVSILRERDAYYSDRRFADVFAHVERAPSSLSPRIQKIPGVARVYTRIVHPVLVPIDGTTMPAVGQIVSLPSQGEAPLNAPRLRSGRLPEQGHDDEVVLLDSFAGAHGLAPGSRLDAVLEGARRRLHVVGTAMSPEYVFAVGPGSFTVDPARFGVLWMDERTVAAAFRMESSFDDVLLSLEPGASAAAVIAAVRDVLRPYGVSSAYARDRQPSNHVLDDKLQQLSSYAVVAPGIFLTVAAFLINVVMVRFLSLQRSQIATLKALGYRNGEVARHYLGFVLLILLGGAALGVALGVLLGRGMVGLYRPYFRFPDLAFVLDVSTVVTCVALSVGAGVAGALVTVIRAARIPPAEAMLPESPAVYRRPILEALKRGGWGVPNIVGVAGRMVLRELVRRPVRAMLSAVAIALATATVISGRFGDDAVSLLFELVFDRAQKDDVEVSYSRPLPASVTHEVAALPGIIHAEGRRTVAVRAHAGSRYRDVGIVGHDTAVAAPLRSLPRWPMRTFSPPESGVAVSRKLAEVLDVSVGSTFELELLEGDRRAVRVVVTELLDDVFGLGLHTSLAHLRRLLDEEGNVTSTLLVVDRAAEDRLLERLAAIPRVASIARRRDVMEKFHEQTEYMWVTMSILTAMGATIAFGVVYNQARIALSTRARDLASLRVLGFTRREISAVLLGELAAYVVVGVPLGWLLGSWLVGLISGSADPESYRMPTYVSAGTFAFGTLAIVLAAAASALLVRRNLYRLDLVSVLKARE